MKIAGLEDLVKRQIVQLEAATKRLSAAQAHVQAMAVKAIEGAAGMKEEALDWLEKAYDAHDPNMPYLSVDPIFDDLRDQPRFQAILKKMGLPT